MSETLSPFGQPVYGRLLVNAAGLQADGVPAMHFPERHERSTVVHFCPGVFTALMEGHDDFALRSARQESAAVVGRDCFGGIVALAANQFRSLHGTPALTEMDRGHRVIHSGPY